MPIRMTPGEVFAEELYAHRSRRGWTQQELADRMADLGEPINRSGIARLENGERKVSLDEAVAFAIALGVPPYALVVPRQVDREVRVTSKWAMAGPSMLAWWRGVQPYFSNPTPKGSRAQAELISDARFYDDSRSDAESMVAERLAGVVDIWSWATLAMREAAVAVTESAADARASHREGWDSPESVLVEEYLANIADELKHAVRQVQKLVQSKEVR